MRFTNSVRFDRTRLLVGCAFGRHDWMKQAATFGPDKVAPDGNFYEAYYCGWCGCGYPAPTLAKKIWAEVRGK